LNNPVNGKAGQKGIIYILQGAGGGKTITTWPTPVLVSRQHQTNTQYRRRKH
jgi:hypothetical protein